MGSFGVTGTDRRLFCFGLGYSARRLAEELAAQGWLIAGTCRDPKLYDQLISQGYDVWLFDRDTVLPSDCDALDRATHILSSVPPDEDGDPVIDLAGPRLRMCSKLIWGGYLSTTGVYGDTAGKWIDESAALKPTNARSRRRALAEKAWMKQFAEYELPPPHIFRLAGIYGPGRSAIDTVRAGRAHRIDKPGHAFSRIHVDDLVAILRVSMGLSRSGAIYNVCDDEPAPQEQVIAYACELLGVDVPPLIPFEDADLSEMARSFYADNRRVRNERVKSVHGLRLQYPTYREGVRSLANLVK
jgi:nucleoside-diphosphate-sugar epimerase